MEIRKSGKIAVGIIAAMGTIGALHMFVFRDRAKEYSDAKSAYVAANSTYSSQGTAPRNEDIQRFRFESLKYKLKFWKDIQDLRLALPDYAVGDPSVNTPDKQRQTYWDILSELEKRRDAGEKGDGPVLRFLGPGANSWDLAKLLPKKFNDGKVAVDDELTTLRNESRLLKSLTVGTAAYMARESEYLRRLNELGLNLLQRDGRLVPLQQGGVTTDGTGIVDKYGSVAATLMTLNRMQLIMGKLQPDFFGSKNENEKRDEMYQLFRVNWAKDFNGVENAPMVQRQGEALVSIIDIAKQESIEAILHVKLYPITAQTWVDPEKASATPAPAAAMNMTAMGGDAEMAMMNQAMDGNASRGAGSMYLEGGFAGATPTPVADITGVGTAMEIAVLGTNASVMSFIYRLTHEKLPYEVDRVRIRIAPKTNPNEESKVQAIFFVNVVTYSVFLGSNTDTTVERAINETERDMADLALKPGLRDAALKEGMITLDGNTPKLVNPSPTVFPSPTPTLVPPPPTPGAALPPPRPAAAPAAMNPEEVVPGA